MSKIYSYMRRLKRFKGIEMWIVKETKKDGAKSVKNEFNPKSVKKKE